MIRALALASVLALPMIARSDEPIPAAAATAKAWLALVDAAKYDASWDEAASFFKAAVTKAEWAKTAGAVRVPLGAVKQRKWIGAQFARTVPGAPDGEYVILQFETQFANKASAVETVTPMKDKDGRWHVSGYFIK